MKHTDYRLVIIAIVAVVLSLIALKLGLSRINPSRSVLTVNTKKITEEEFNRAFEKKSPKLSRNDFIDSLIMKELLVQEAIHEGIQNGESFRQSVRNFYEQSLIKSVIDKKYASIKPQIDETLVDRYIELSDKTLDLTLLTYRQVTDIVKGKIDSEKNVRIPFKRLSNEVKYELLSLNEGGTSSPGCPEYGGECSVFRFNRIASSSDGFLKETNRDLVRQILMDQKKELIVTSWMDDLKKKATIHQAEASESGK